MQQLALYILQYQRDINAGQPINQEHGTQLILDGQIFSSFNNIRGTPQYYKNMLLDVLAKICQFCVYTFFLTCSAAEFHCTEIIQAVVRQYGESLSVEQGSWMIVWIERYIDYVFKQLWGKVILWNASYWSNFKFR